MVNGALLFLPGSCKIASAPLFLQAILHIINLLCKKI